MNPGTGLHPKVGQTPLVDRMTSDIQYRDEYLIGLQGFSLVLASFSVVTQKKLYPTGLQGYRFEYILQALFIN